MVHAHSSGNHSITQLSLESAVSIKYRVHTLLLKKIQDFSRTFQDHRRNFPGPLRSPQMLIYKEKWGKTFTHTVQSMGMGKRCPPPQPTRGSGGASLAPPAGSGAEPRPKTVFSRTFQDQSEFPGLSSSWIFQEKKSSTFQDFPGGVGTL